MEKWVVIEKVIGGFTLLAGLFVGFLLLVWLPVNLLAERECLARGYPHTNTTIALESYCINMEGVVTMKVVRK